MVEGNPYMYLELRKIKDMGKLVWEIINVHVKEIRCNVFDLLWKCLLFFMQPIRNNDVWWNRKQKPPTTKVIDTI